MCNALALQDVDFGIWIYLNLTAITFSMTVLYMHSSLTVAAG